MASTRDIKLKTKSVKSIQQITQAMNLVAASKLQRARQRLDHSFPFFNETERAITSVLSASRGIKHEFLEAREPKKTAVIVIAADRGLCGGYNSNVCKEGLTFVREKDNVLLITVGSKSKEFFSRRYKGESTEFLGISEKPAYEDAAKIGRLITKLYLDKEIDEAYVVYTSFKSVLVHNPKIKKLLPFDVSGIKTVEELGSEHDKKQESLVMLYEPSEEAVLDYIIPKFINTVIFGALVESSVSEQGARMTAMDSATENAEDIIQSYTLLYNRVRQGAITQEITEIVSGANALE